MNFDRKAILFFIFRLIKIIIFANNAFSQGINLARRTKEKINVIYY